MQTISNVSETWAFDLNAARAMAQQLGAGEPVSDGQFGAILPPHFRRASRQHWTPVAVARRAAELLTDGKPCRVLDVGSGVGKFCLVGALTSDACFFGVERRKSLVLEAKQLSSALKVSRVDFECRDVSTLDWSAFDAIYLYNPFQENIDHTAQIDSSFELNAASFARFVRMTQEKLETVKVGTRVVTFHGFGGVFPEGYVRHVREHWSGDYLELWIKSAPSNGATERSAEDDYFTGACTD